MAELSILIDEEKNLVYRGKDGKKALARMDSQKSQTYLLYEITASNNWFTISENCWSSKKKVGIFPEERNPYHKEFHRYRGIPYIDLYIRNKYVIRGLLQALQRAFSNKKNKKRENSLDELK